MIFHSLTYLVFLAVVLALYWSLPRRGQNLMLIFASYIFYGWEHPWFLLPLWASTRGRLQLRARDGAFPRGSDAPFS